ncbi:hypothetical protein [Paenibacillus lemnae]|uniref:Uncharacterized protein n=1 Tax=Paenibacillus lemnae TaxID=1330551 RepID=A0A848M4Y1_PAELE|nr:hypothetical protein [Paenibacillus lemnae]NMO95815.1 hypothetical protein [Paenibacillus lemnae]
MNIIWRKEWLYEYVSGDKNIATLEIANYAVFFIYVIKFLSKRNDKNLITFPTDDKNIVTLPI